MDGSGFRPFAVLTLHRPSNVDFPETLQKLLGAIEQVADELPVIFPVHPRTYQRLKRFGVCMSTRNFELIASSRLSGLSVPAEPGSAGAHRFRRNSGGNHGPWRTVPYAAREYGTAHYRH